jgi:Protein of unknown function (DUF1569)
VPALNTLSDPGAKAQLLERLRRVRPDSTRKWGRMDAHQMVCHLTDAFLGAMGEKTTADASSLFTRSLLKWVALYGPAKWPPGVRTIPEMDQEIGGTRPVDFAHDRERLEHTIERFARTDRECPDFRHPVFGRLSKAQWMRWAWLHLDHHLRQFGV